MKNSRKHFAHLSHKSDFDDVQHIFEGAEVKKVGSDKIWEVKSIEDNLMRYKRSALGEKSIVLISYDKNGLGTISHTKINDIIEVKAKGGTISQQIIDLNSKGKHKEARSLADKHLGMKKTHYGETTGVGHRGTAGGGGSHTDKVAHIAAKLVRTPLHLHKEWNGDLNKAKSISDLNDLVIKDGSKVDKAIVQSNSFDGYDNDAEMTLKGYAKGGKVAKNEDVLNSFMSSTDAVHTKNLSTHYNSHEGSVLLRNYDTLIAIRKGGRIWISKEKFSKTTTIITNKLKSIIDGYGGYVIMDTKDFAEGGSIVRKYSKSEKKYSRGGEFSVEYFDVRSPYGTYAKGGSVDDGFKVIGNGKMVDSYGEELDIIKLDLGRLDLGTNYNETHFLNAIREAHDMEALTDLVRTFPSYSTLILTYRTKYGGGKDVWDSGEFYHHIDDNDGYLYAEGGDIMTADTDVAFAKGGKLEPSLYPTRSDINKLMGMTQIDAQEYIIGSKDLLIQHLKGEMNRVHNLVNEYRMFSGDSELHESILNDIEELADRNRFAKGGDIMTANYDM